MSELELEHRTNIKFLVKLGKSGNEIREMLVQVYGDNAMKKTAVYRRVKSNFFINVVSSVVYFFFSPVKCVAYL